MNINRGNKKKNGHKSDSFANLNSFIADKLTDRLTDLLGLAGYLAPNVYVQVGMVLSLAFDPAKLELNMCQGNL